MSRIAIASNSDWYLYNFRASTIRSLIEQGFEVVAIVPKGTHSDQLSELGANVVHVPLKAAGRNPLEDLRYLNAFRNVLRDKNIKALLCFTPKANIFGGLAARSLHIPYINNIAGLGNQFEKPGMITRVVNFLYQVSQPSAFHIFFQNEQDQATFLTRGYASEHNSSRLMGSGVDLSRFHMAPLPDRPPFRFLFMGRMLVEKGIPELIDVARRLRARHGDKVEFQMLGYLDWDNPSAISSQQMDDWVSEGIVTYCGTTDDVRPFITNAHAVVLPTYYGEGVPKSLIEALAIGRPVITTDHPGCRDVVSDDNGILIPARDTDALEAACEAMMASSEADWQDMSNRSRRLAENVFSDTANIEAYLSVIRRALDEK